MKSLLVSLKSVGVNRNDSWIIRDVSIDFHRGQIVSIVGPNGGGKTTVAKVLAKSIMPDAGIVNREDRLSISYVPQRIKIDAALPMTVRRLMSLNNISDRHEIDSTLEQLGILELQKRQIQNLSGGEFQRAILARALLRKPDLMILDEPTQGLDHTGELNIHHLIANIRERLNCGILLIDHRIHLGKVKADTVICLKNHIWCQGTPEQVVKDEAFTQLFGENAANAPALCFHHDYEHVVLN